MNLTVELPDAIAHRLRLDGPDAQVCAREIIALHGYKSGQLSRAQVGDLLRLSFYECEEFLKAHGGQIPTTVDEVYQDVHALEALLTR
jgi:hypothetical protein